jgi:drug/metabolite transporter (DMT)-like permease
MQESMAGWGNGLLGVIIFSASLPATRIAVSGFSPLFLTSARAVIAAALGIMLLVVLKQSRPSRPDFVSLVIGPTGPKLHIWAFIGIFRERSARLNSADTGSRLRPGT